MIDAKSEPSASAFIARLTAKAKAIGRADAESRARAARQDPARWRKANLLWPLF